MAGDGDAAKQWEKSGIGFWVPVPEPVNKQQLHAVRRRTAALRRIRTGKTRNGRLCSPLGPQLQVGIS